MDAVKVEPLAKNSDTMLTNVGGLPLFPELDLENLPGKDIIKLASVCGIISNRSNT